MLRRILPGVLSECFGETPGSWLFRRPYCDWLSDGALVSQLPLSYRMFARYCAAQRGNPVGAELLLRLIIRLRQGAHARSVVRLNVGDMPIFVDLTDPRFLMIPGELSEGLPRVLNNFLQHGDTFVDVGANHGSFAITASKLVGAEGLVIAIEPQARLAELTRRSLELYPARFIAHNVACGDSTGTAILYVPRASSGSAGLHPTYSASSQHQTANVPLVRLDDLLQRDPLPGRVFVKLDVEGSEAACLRGARDFLARVKPAVLVEINSAALKAAGSSTGALMVVLNEAGYDRCLAGEQLDQERALTADIADLNIVALHESQDAGRLRT